MKKYYYQLLLIVSLTGLNSVVNAQSKFWNFDNLTLRKSFQSKNDKAEAASITFNKPKDTTGSWATDIAIGYNILSGVRHTTITLDPYVELHKNTLVKKKQDSREIGAALQWQMHNLDSNGRGSSPILIFAAKYNQDKIKQNYSLRSNLYLTAFFDAPRDKFYSFLIPNNLVTAGSVFDFVYAPYIGVEQENRTKTNLAAAKGHIYRFYARVNPTVSLFPKSASLQGKIALSADYQFRYDFDKTVSEIAKDRHEYFTAGVNYAFIQESTKSAKIGFDYIKGEDPTANFQDQSYYAISLKVKL